MLSVVIPTLNSAATLPATLAPLVEGALRGLVREVVVADGGSTDATLSIAEETGAVITACAGPRGAHLQAGATIARGDALLFLHTGTVLSPGWIEETAAFLARPDARRRAAAFAFAVADRSFAARCVAAWVDLRCLAFALPYGDQGLLISRELYDEIGGFRPLPEMEDIDIVWRIGRRRLTLLRSRAVTSAAQIRRADGLLRLARIARMYAGARRGG